MNAGGLEPTHYSLMHPEKWFMFYRNCVTRSPIRPFFSHSEAACVHSRHALIHTPPYLFRLRHLPSEESHNPGCQTVKRRSRPPGDRKTAPRCEARSEHVHKSSRVFPCRGRRSGVWGAEFILCRWSEMLWCSSDHRRICRHPTPFSQSRCLRLPDRTDRHINGQRVTQEMESHLTLH